MAFSNNSKSSMQNISSLRANSQMESQTPSTPGSENIMQNDNSFALQQTNDSGINILRNNNGFQSQMNNNGLGMIETTDGVNGLNSNREIVDNALEMPKFGLGKINNNYKIVGGTNLI